MAATLVGEAAIRIVPTLRGFKTEAERSLRSMEFEPIRVRLEPRLAEADAKMDEWRARQDLTPVNVPVRMSGKNVDSDLKTIEHRVQQSSLSQLTTFNIKILGLDALPALAYAAASAASGLDALGEATLALPGLFGAAAISAATLALGLDNVKQTFSGFITDQTNASQRARTLAEDNRSVERSYRSYRDAVRDTTREIQDLNAENRRSSLNVADAMLSVQEAADRLREGNFSTITEQRRAQLSYAESIDHVNEVLTKANRTQEDTNRVNALGVQGSDKVQNALDQIANSTAKLSADKLGAFGRDLAKLSPNAQAAVKAVTGLRGEFLQLQHGVQDNLFAGVDKDITNLAHTLLPGLSIGLSRVATGLNTNVRAIFAAIPTRQNQTLLQRIFGDTDGGLRNLSAGMKPLIDGVMRLTAVSSDFLPRLGSAASAVFGRFDAWTDKISKDGSLKKWIDQGLHAMDDLGHIGTGILSVIHSIGQAFNEVSGHDGGFLKTFADEMEKVANHLKSPEGEGKLVGYLQSAKQEIHEIRAGWDEMKPTVQELVGYAREWSTSTISVLGNVLQLVGAFDRATHAVGPLMEFFLYVRAAKMSFGVLSDLNRLASAPMRGASSASAWWNNLGNTPQAAQAQARFNAVQQRTNALLSTAQQRMQGLTAATANTVMETSKASEQALRYGTAVDKAGNQYDAFGNVVGKVNEKVKDAGSATETATSKFPALEQAVSNTVPPLNDAAGGAEYASSKIKDAGQAAEDAGEKVGSAGAGFVGKLGALASMVGPQLALSAGLIGVTSLIGKLGEANRLAAEQAEAEATALRHVAESLDNLTGHATAQTITDTAKAFQSLPVQNFGNVNINDQFTKAGINPQQAILAATDSTQGALLQSILGPQDAAVQKELEANPDYQRTKKQWDDAGVDSLTLAKAINNDSDALAKVRDVLSHPHFVQEGNHAVPVPMPDLSALAHALPNQAPFLSAFALRGASQQNYATAQSNLGASAAARGKQRLSPQGQADFGQYDPEPDTMRLDESNRGVIVLRKSPDKATLDHWRDDLHFDVPDTPLPDGSIQITLPPEFSGDLQGFATGGLVRGKGGPTDDANLVKVSDFEHITQAKAVNFYGTKLFDDLNNMRIPRSSIGRFATGGFPLAPPLIPPPPPLPNPLLTPGNNPVPAASTSTVPGPDASGNVPLYFDPATGSTTPPTGTPTTGTPHIPDGTTPGPPGPSMTFDPSTMVNTGMWPGGVPADLVPGSSLDPNGQGGSNPWELMQEKWANLLNPQRDMQNIQAHYAEALSPNKVFDFLGSQAKLVGQSLLGIGLDFLDGITGLNLSELLGPGQQVGNYMMSMLSPMANPGATSLNSGAGQGISDYMKGMPGLTPQMMAAMGGAMGASGPQSAALKGFASQVAGKVPYVWGGFSMEGMDCSGLALAMANIATGHGPFDGGRDMSTHNEASVLTSKGFVSGAGAPGELTIGWSDDHTGVTLPDGTHIDAQGTATGIVMGQGSQGATGFPNVMHLPMTGGYAPAYAAGGQTGKGLAFLSNGEYRTGAAATKYYGPKLFNALNSMQIPLGAIGHFDDGGWPGQFPLTDLNHARPIQPPPAPQGQSAGPLPMTTPPRPTAPGLGGAAGMRLPSMGLTARKMSPPKPTPPPGAPKGGIGATVRDNRGGIGVVGPAPKTNDHLNPAISAGVSGAAQAIGSAAGTAASVLMPGMGGAASSLIGGAMQVGASAVNDGLNILASLMTPNTGPASGIPLLPERQQQATATAPVHQRIHNGDVHVTNLEEYKRTQETMDAQLAMPYIGKYG